MKGKKILKTCPLTSDENKWLQHSGLILDMCSSAVPIGTSALMQEHATLIKMIDQLTRSQLGNEYVENTEKPVRNTDLDSFLEWCKGKGVISEGVEIKAVSPVEGLGLVATRELKKGECLVKVPQKAMLTFYDAKKSLNLGKAIEMDPLLKGMPNVALALFILMEKLKGKESAWEPYINMLPQSYSTPLYFKDHEMQLLKGSPMLESTLRLFRNIARQFAYFHQLLGSEKSVMYKGHMSPLTLANLTFANYRWSVVTVMTRINLVPSPDGSDRMPALIPFFDVANHRGGPQYPVTTDYSDHLMMGLCYAQADFSVGNQVYINYGARPNADLLLHDGFVPDENNPDDTYKMKLGLSSMDKHLPVRIHALTAMGIVPSNRSGSQCYEFEIPVIGLQKPLGDMIEIHWRPLITANLQAFARVFTANEELLTQIVDNKSLTPATPIGGVENDLKAWTFLKNRFSLMIRAYGAPEPAGLNETLAVIMAKRLIKCEKQLLQAAANFAEDEINDIMIEMSNAKSKNLVEAEIK